MARLSLLALALGLAVPVPAGAAGLDRWGAEVAEASLRFGIPAQWIRRVMRAESNGETMLNGRPIVSPAGAMGLMQLMPGTWRDIRASLSLGSDPFDPRENILAGAFYLRRMYDRFGYPGMFAAYNAGPARYRAYLAHAATLPAETRLYVASITGSANARALAARMPPRGRPAQTLGADPRPARASPFVAAPTGLFVALGPAASRCC